MGADNYNNSQFNQNFAIVCDALGNNPSQGRSEGLGQKPLCDREGRLLVRTIPWTPGFDPQTLQALSGGALVSETHIQAGAVKLVALAGFNADALNFLYVQIHDIAAGPIPPGNIPDVIIPVPALSAFSYSLPIEFGSGLGLAISTTPLTYTAPAAPALSFSILYQVA
jgi:hypothetical protein